MDGVNDSDEEELNSADDDEDDELETDNQLLCRCTRVTRISGADAEFRCEFVAGILHINGKDYQLFKTRAIFVWT